MAMEMNMFLCLFVVVTHADPVYIPGRLFIEGRNKNIGDEAIPTPTDFMTGNEWARKKNDMEESWVRGDRFHDFFVREANSCTGNFVIEGIPCHKNETRIDCHLNETYYQHLVMLYLGYEIRGNADIYFKMPSMPWKRLHVEHNGRNCTQLVSLGHRQLSHDSYEFKFRMECKSNNCSLVESQFVLFAYQARYEPPLCRM